MREALLLILSKVCCFHGNRKPQWQPAMKHKVFCFANLATPWHACAPALITLMNRFKFYVISILILGTCDIFSFERCLLLSKGRTDVGSISYEKHSRLFSILFETTGRTKTSIKSKKVFHLLFLSFVLSLDSCPQDCYWCELTSDIQKD